MFITYVVYNDVHMDVKFYQRTRQTDGDVVVQHGPAPVRQRGDVPTVLLWTKYFGHRWYYTDISGCPYRCRVTDNRGELTHATALLFHFLDLQKDDFPKHHAMDQVWILLTQEPPSKMGKDLGGYRYVFNWTASYRRDSTVIYPYGQIIKRRQKKKNSSPQFEKKSEFAFAAVSNIYDGTQRYRVLDELYRLNSKIQLFGNTMNVSVK